MDLTTITGPAARLVTPKPVPHAREPAAADTAGTRDNAALRKAAFDLEAAFLTEMLKSTGLGKTRVSYGGGAGEDQFNSLLIRAQAEQMTKAGGIGLAESLYQALLETQNDTD